MIKNLEEKNKLKIFPEWHMSFGDIFLLEYLKIRVNFNLRFKSHIHAGLS